MARVLVTGATGFIGGYLVESLLERGDEVVCFTRASSVTERLASLDVQIVQGDLDDTESLKSAVVNVDIVFHLAALVAALSERKFMRINADATGRLTAACAAQPNPPVLLMVSSLAVAGAAIDGVAVQESDACRPVSNYGHSKRAGELAAAEFADRVPLTIVRPPIVFGGRDRSTWNLFAPISRFGVHFVPGYRHRRLYSLIHCSDLVNAIVLTADGGRRVDVADAGGDSFRQGCYFAAFDDQPTFAEFGNLIGQAFGRRFVAKFPLPDTIVKCIGGFNELVCQARKKPHVFGIDKTRDVAAGSWICSTEKIKSELGFAAEPLTDRLSETAEWFRAAGWSK
jgi:nucleoside-diphosphate-sugar epimerase